MSLRHLVLMLISGALTTLLMWFSGDLFFSVVFAVLIVVASYYTGKHPKPPCTHL